MASKKISNKDLFKGSLFNEPIQEANALLKVLDKLKDTIKGIGAVNKKFAKQVGVIGATTEEIEKLSAVEEESIKLAKQKLDIEKTETKIREKLNTVESGALDTQIKLRDELSKSNKARKEEVLGNQRIIKLEEKIKNVKEGKLDNEIKLRKELARQNKIRKKAIEEEEDLDDVYTKTSKRLNEVRKAQKNLNIQQKLGTKLTKEQAEEYKELTEEVEELDGALKEVDAEAGQHQREVGNYAKATGTAKAGFSSLSGFLLGAMASSFKKTRKGGRDLEVAMAKFGSVMNSIVNGLIELWENKLSPTISIAMDEISITISNFELKWLRLQALLSLGATSKKFTKDADKIAEDIKKMQEEVTKAWKVIDESKNPLSKEEIDKTIKAIEENLKAIEKLAKAEDVLVQRRQKLSVEIDRITSAEESFQSVADDTTKSFIEQQEALKLSLAEREKRFVREEEIAKKEAEFALERVNINLRENKQAIIRNVADAQRLEILDDFAKADMVSEENLLGLTEAIRNLEAVQGSISTARAESQRQAREISRDTFEQELDFAIDIFDNQKTINEQKIADETKTFKERFGILNRTKELNEQSFKSQTDLVEEFTKKKIDFNALINEDDEKIVRQRVKNLKLDETTTTRVLEIIRERKTFTQDLIVAERELGVAFEESAEKSINARRDLREFRAEVEIEEAEKVFDKEKELFLEHEVFVQAQYKKALKSLEVQTNKELDLLKLTSSRELAEVGLTEDEKNLIRAKAEKEKNDILAKSLDERNSLERDANEKTEEDTKETAENIAQVLDFLAEKQRERFEERQSDLDKEIQNSKDRESELRELAKDRIVDSDKNLAFEQRKQAELEKEKEKEQKRQQLRELGFTALKTYTAKVEAGEKNPVLETIQDITLLLTAINSLPKFFGGSSKISNDLSPTLNTGRDDYMIRVDGDEKVFTGEHSQRIGYDMSNEQVVNVVEKFKRGDLGMQSVDNYIVGGGFQNNDAILSKFDSLEKTIANLPSNMPVSDFRYNEVENAVTTILKKRGSVVRNHVKQGSIW